MVPERTTTFYITLKLNCSSYRCARILAQPQLEGMAVAESLRNTIMIKIKEHYFLWTQDILIIYKYKNQPGHSDHKQEHPRTTRVMPATSKNTYCAASRCASCFFSLSLFFFLSFFFSLFFFDLDMRKDNALLFMPGLFP